MIYNNAYWKFDESKHYKPSLNTTEFFKLSGFDFCWFILGSISHEDVETTKSDILSFGQKALYYWSFLEIQVPNGGFTQFYYNDYGRYVPTILKGLQYIKDFKMSDLVSRSYDLYLKEQNKVNSAKQRGMQAFSDLYKELKDFDELDNEYYNINEITMKMLENFARRNPSEFCNNVFCDPINSNQSIEFKSFYDDDKIKEIIPFSKGMVNGIFKSYFSNGNLRDEIFYYNGEQTGETIEYYENGNRKSSVLKSKVNDDIIHSKYFQNGNPKSTIIQTSKKIRKIQSCWKEDGTQILKDGTGLYIYENSYFKNSITRNEQEYRNYKRHGKQYTFRNNKITLFQEMFEGKAHGITKTYDNDGNIIQEIVYNHGKEVSRKIFEK